MQSGHDLSLLHNVWGLNWEDLHGWGWNDLDASSLTCLVPGLGCVGSIRTVDWSEASPGALGFLRAWPLHGSRISYTAAQGFKSVS